MLPVLRARPAAPGPVAQVQQRPWDPSSLDRGHRERIQRSRPIFEHFEEQYSSSDRLLLKCIYVLLKFLAYKCIRYLLTSREAFCPNLLLLRFNRISEYRSPLISQQIWILFYRRGKDSQKKRDGTKYNCWWNIIVENDFFRSEIKNGTHVENVTCDLYYNFVCTVVGRFINRKYLEIIQLGDIKAR